MFKQVRLRWQGIVKLNFCVLAWLNHPAWVNYQTIWLLLRIFFYYNTPRYHQCGRKVHCCSLNKAMINYLNVSSHDKWKAIFLRMKQSHIQDLVMVKLGEHPTTVKKWFHATSIFYLQTLPEAQLLYQQTVGDFGSSSYQPSLTPQSNSTDSLIYLAVGYRIELLAVETEDRGISLIPTTWEKVSGRSPC